jgi:1-acyl-sn-glycerol-3-phosphate acyltransferase
MVRRLLGNREFRRGLFGLVVALTLGLGAVVLHARAFGPDGADRELAPTVGVAVGLLIGLLAERWFGGRLRVVGLIPHLAMVATAAAVVSAAAGGCPVSTGVIVAVALGTALVLVQALVAHDPFVLNAPAKPRLLLVVLAPWLGSFAVGAAVVLVALTTHLPLAGWRVALAVAALGWAALSWRWYFRPGWEVIAESLIWPSYRVRAVGPGLADFPMRGPALVIANHAAWFDPIWLAKTLPRPVTPLMTSGFYDLPVLRWIMSRSGVIRVPDAPLRREAPELGLAAEALRRGECVMIFPEGYLRRRETHVLRRFGRGVWLVLKDCPETPVYPCWVEGGWGSFTSHWKGPPAKNKRPDWRRRIDVGVAGPITVPPAVLADAMATRRYLMDACLRARGLLGLPPLEDKSAPAAGEKDDEGGGSVPEPPG